MEKSFAAASISEDATRPRCAVRTRGQDFFVGKSLGAVAMAEAVHLRNEAKVAAEEEGIE